MKLNNFKELLLRKTADNDNLQLLIKYIRDDYLLDHIVESLSKMAASDANRKTNAAVKHFGTHMDEHVEGEMIHDQLSHHASNYKAALGAGNTSVADQHMRKIFNTMYMANKVTRDGKENHSGGKLTVEAVDPKPWEEHLYADSKTDTNGWKQDRKDYGYLRSAPHAGREGQGRKNERYRDEIRAHGHNKAYPLNEIKVNGKHIHIEDAEHDGSFKDHPFDSHPILKHSRTPSHAHKDVQHEDYINDSDAFHGEGGGAGSYWDLVDTRDPKEHAARGSKKSDTAHPEVEGLDISTPERKSKAVSAKTKTDEAPKQSKTDKEKFDDLMARLKESK